MSALERHPALAEIVEAQGWTDYTLLDLALDFIADTGLAPRFAAVAQEAAKVSTWKPGEETP
jgi:hypothetical protein